MLFSHTIRQFIQGGTIRLIDANGKSYVYSDGEGPPVTVRLHDRSLHRKLVFSPALRIGEAYMNGTLTIEEGTLYDFLDICARNYRRFESLPLPALMLKLGRVLRYLYQFNPVSRARANVAHHYDLNGELYRLFLDEDQQYSCAYYLSGNESLEIAQHNKKRHIAAKLLLEPGQKVLDIGSGWGGLGLFLAETAGVDVTGLTLSEEQHRASEARARRAGLAKRVRFLLKDYREETGSYDRIVSVGMFEHVGVGHYRSFFETVRELLSNDGVMLLHSIGRMEPPGGTNAWIRKYIFPGGYTPALSEVMAAVEKAGLWVTDVEVLRLHYADTLREWRRRFQLNRDKAKEIYDERFCRMWEFYLVGCEVAFRHMDQMVFQMQLAKRQDAVPLTRDYITDWERSEAGRISAQA